jgi:hypothetical protein
MNTVPMNDKLIATILLVTMISLLTLVFTVLFNLYLL